MAGDLKFENLKFCYLCSFCNKFICPVIQFENNFRNRVDCPKNAIFLEFQKCQQNILLAWHLKYFQLSYVLYSRTILGSICINALLRNCFAKPILLLLLAHRLRTPNEAFFHRNPKLQGLGRQFGLINSGAFEVLSANLSSPVLVL